jgi:hypothetical protein
MGRCALGAGDASVTTVRRNHVFKLRLGQWSSTLGTRAPGGTRKHLTGYVKFKKKNFFRVKHWIGARFRVSRRRPGRKDIRLTVTVIRVTDLCSLLKASRGRKSKSERGHELRKANLLMPSIAASIVWGQSVVIVLIWFSILSVLIRQLLNMWNITRVTGRGGLWGCEMLRIPHCLDSRLTDGGKVFSPTHRPSSTPQKHYSSASGTHFC